MDSTEFVSFRKKLNKTQKQIAQLLGTSLKAIHSYEQGWRDVRLGSLKRERFVGSLTEPSVKERSRRVGKKK